MKAEQRHFSRIPFRATATVVNSRTIKKTMVQLLDISLKGVLISKPDQWSGSEHENYTLQLQLAGDAVDLNLNLISVHSENNLIGFKTQQMDIDTATHLHRLLELNLGDKNLVKRELAELVNAN